MSLKIQLGTLTATATSITIALISTAAHPDYAVHQPEH